MKESKASQNIMQQRSFHLSGPDFDPMNQRLVQARKVRRMSLAKFIAIVLSAATVTQIPGAILASSKSTALAQQSFGQNPDSFPIPESLPDGTTLKLDGSTSMRLTNEAVEERFEAQYDNIDVELDASRTDQAFEALIKGDIDILATGRPLTEDEKAQGVVEVPLEQREKLAVILGPDNPLPTEDDPATPEIEGNLTFEQFARMFRGEITNWSEVGGPDLPIRFVDRPDYSDTRRALSTYTVFDGKPFETGSTVDPVDVDETDAVVNALGDDGIGYSVVSQVADRDDVRIISMHQTLPDDPRYPYSQYRAFAYKEASPAALAFMGFATSEPGQEVIAGAAPVVVVPESIPPAESVPTADDGAVAPGKGKFPWWWLLLLGLIPLLWLALRGLKGRGAPAPAPTPAGVIPNPRMVLTPRNCHEGYAYWEVPKLLLNKAKGAAMKVRLYDVTGQASDAPLPKVKAEFDCLEDSCDLHLPMPVDGRTYRAEVGYVTADNQWRSWAISEPVKVPVCPQENNGPSTVKARDVKARDVKAKIPAAASAAAIAGTVVGAAAIGVQKPKLPPSRMVLTPRTSRDGYTYWDVPQARIDAAKQQGGKTMKVRLYDVTGRLPDAPLLDPVIQIDCNETEPDRHVPIERAERDYVAQVGYLTQENRWLPLAKSNAIRVSEDLEDNIKEAGAIPWGTLGAVGAGAIATGLSLSKAEEKPNVNLKATVKPVSIEARSPEEFQVEWTMPEEQKAALLNDDAYAPLVKIHDVTEIDLAKQPAHRVTTHPVTSRDFDGNTASMLLPVPRCDRDYLAELGYTHDNDWVSLGKSRHTHVKCPVNVKAPVEDISVEVRSPEEFQVRWAMPADQKTALLSDDAYALEAKVLDVTGIDLANQPAHSVTTHAITSRDFDGTTASKLLLVPQCDRDYLAELGYTHNNNWVSLGKSRHTHVKCPVDLKAPVEDVSIEVYSPEEFQVQWTMPEDQKVALVDDGAYSPQVKIYDVTGIDWARQPSHNVTVHPVTDNNFDGNTASMRLPVPQCDRDYLAELGYGDDKGKWVSLGRSGHTHVNCPIDLKAPVEPILIDVRSPEEFEVRWSMAEEQKLILLNDDAYAPEVQILDVTKIDLAHQPAHSVTVHPVMERNFGGNTASMLLPVPQCDRDYLAELGYTHDNEWVSLGKSRHTHVKCPVNVKAPVEDISVEVRSPEEFQVRWAMPADQKRVLLNDDAYTPQIKILDVTGIDLAHQPPHNVTTHPVIGDDFDGNTASMLLPVPQCDRDYLAELGYIHNNAWVSLGRSRHTHVKCPVNVRAPVAPILIEVHSTEELQVRWSMPEDQKLALLNDDAYTPQVNVLDVTGIDLTNQPAHSATTYPVTGHDFDGNTATMLLPVSQCDRDYLAELGYLDNANNWVALGQSLRTHVTCPPVSQDETPVNSLLAANLGPTAEESGALTPVDVFSKGPTCHQRLMINSQDHTYPLDEENVSTLQANAKHIPLDPGYYILTLDVQTVNNAELDAISEPIIMLWLEGGRFINQKTGVEVTSTWTTLNGYNDSLALNVLESTNVYAVFFNTTAQIAGSQLTLLMLKDE
ncbi:MAG: DUF4912 domain-containing protein [Leptolyngbyaceae cyanobacterium MAG.088]|nr:DUF4912 domain-containing protein [Leptolyngbyaceae cyanobacterium MAG.088]